ncbi:HAMP domain-containing methyl-accepting chemotaxis protein [Shewanella frigidimarina]|uniref:HAMP domain-containing methyl-accepting chemotaxis protein n=1 Tax=Shewanella frigidimarina TaxID=56812 RepID=UPI003D7ACABB
MLTSIKLKLLLAFGTIFLLLLLSSLSNYIKLMDTAEVQTKVIDLRMVTVVAGKDITNGINSSLAALRGYMILGSDPQMAQKMSSEREEAWSNIDSSLAILSNLSVNWTDPTNKAMLSELESVLAEFKVSQEQIQTISNTPENIKSYHLLITDAAPRASKILDAITAIIDEEATLEATDERKLLLKQLADSRGSFAIGLANIRAYLLSGNSDFKDKFASNWQANTQAFDNIDSLAGILFTPSQNANWQIYQTIRLEFAPLPQTMFQLREANDWNQANHLLGSEAAPRASKALEILGTMRTSQDELLAEDIVNLKSNTQNMQVTLIGSAVVSLFISVLIGIWFSKDLLSRLMPILDRAKDISNNKLSGTPLPIQGKDELAELTREVNAMSLALQQVVESTALSMNEAAEGADAIFDSNSAMAEEITMQVDQVNMIAAAIEELSASAADVSMNSTDATHSSDDSLKLAENGGNLMDKSLEQMNEISEAFNESSTSIDSLSQQSHQIEGILSVIRGIAEQTNLLALNAAIEAARAGEQGRGFAVVADEVRQLATRTTEATQEVEQAIDAMRNDTQTVVSSMAIGREKVTQGIKVSHQVADMLKQIIDKAKDVALKVESIATTSEQQSAVTGDIASNISQTSMASQKVKEGIQGVVEMAKKVSENTIKRADELKTMINS